jgi:hypothetical protein
MAYGTLTDWVPEMIGKRLDEDELALLILAFTAYITMASHYALSNGLATVTWNVRLHEVVASCTDSILRGAPFTNELLLERQQVKNRLGEMILEEHVPDVADLPLEEVLEIRRKRKSEILAFRDGLRQLAADIEPSQDAKTLEAALDSKIQAVFKPALRDLKVATAELQADAYRRLFHPPKEVGTALIPVAISLSAGAPVETAATVGAASALVAKLYEFIVGTAIEKRKITNASPWSLVFHLQKKGRD